MKRKRSGFSIPEMMVAMVAAAVLVLSVGCLLFYTIRSWVRNTTTIEVQRDATAAMDVLARAVHRCAYTNLSFASGTLATPPSAFKVVGRRLIFLPNAQQPGNQTVVVKDRLDLFEPALTNNVVRLHLKLSAGDEVMDVQTILKCRNP